MANKVNFGLKNVHFAPYTKSLAGEYIYEKPIRIPGAVNLELSPNDSSSTFFADNSAYFTSYSGGGQYEGTLEVANLPQEFLVKCLGETVITGHNLLGEVASPKKQNFALLFQVEGDERDTKFCFFNCSCSRPSVSSTTTTESTDPVTNELSFTAIPREGDELVKLKTIDTTSAGHHDSWFERVYDKVLNSVNRGAPAFDKKTDQQADIVETITTTGGAVPTGLKMNGISVQAGNSPTTNENWQYATNQFTIKKALLNTLEVGKHLVILQMDKGNNISIDLEVKDTTV